MGRGVVGGWGRVVIVAAVVVEVVLIVEVVIQVVFAVILGVCGGEHFLDLAGDFSLQSGGAGRRAESRVPSAEWR